MDKPSSDSPTRRRHRREKAIIDHLADRVFDRGNPGPEHPPTTDSGTSVEEQVRKEWDPKKNGGLPVF